MYCEHLDLCRDATLDTIGTVYDGMGTDARSETENTLID